MKHGKFQQRIESNKTPNESSRTDKNIVFEIKDC